MLKRLLIRICIDYFDMIGVIKCKCKSEDRKYDYGKGREETPATRTIGLCNEHGSGSKDIEEPDTLHEVISEFFLPTIKFNMDSILLNRF